MLTLQKFFLSSRRRHTRWPRDWSSDVCSSDLTFVEGTDRGLVDEVGPAGLDKPLDDGVRHLQGTVRATDPRARDAGVSGVVVRAERGVGEGCLRFAVPDLLVELLGQAGEVLLRVVVGAVVVARDIDRIA